MPLAPAATTASPMTQLGGSIRWLNHNTCGSFTLKWAYSLRYAVSPEWLYGLYLLIFLKSPFPLHYSDADSNCKLATHSEVYPKLTIRS